MSMEIKDELLDIEGIKNSNKNLLDLFIRRTAVITSTQETLVEKIVKSQWQKANKATKDDSDVAEIDFCNLGTFYMSPSKAKKRVVKLERHNVVIRAIPEGTPERDKTKRVVTISRNENTIKNIKFKTKQITNEC
jgi:hypothetical protein